jgi:hypothetical protein
MMPPIQTTSDNNIKKRTKDIMRVSGVLAS